MSIENFRGIGRLDLECGPVTVVIGENNSGKTSVFDVLGLFLGRRALQRDAQLRADDFYRGRGDSRPRSTRVVLTFEWEDAPRSHAPADAYFGEAAIEDGSGVKRVRAEFRADPDDRRISSRFIDVDGQPLDPQPDGQLLERLQTLHPVLLLRFAQPHLDRIPEGAPSASDNLERRGRRNLEALIERVYRDLARTRGPVPKKQIANAMRAARRLYGAGGGEAERDSGPLQRMLGELVSNSASEVEGERDAPRAVRSGSGSHTVGLLTVLGAMLEERGEEALPNEARPIIAIEEPEAHLHPILLASTWDVIEGLGAQTVVTTNSGELLSSVPLGYLRRLVRSGERIDVRRLSVAGLTPTDLRRVSYHVRAKRGGVLFGRCWLLVEGESEFWLLTQLARVLGYDLEGEGVRCVEFAQCGVVPLVKLANDLGIEWHLLVDGDESGERYARDASRHLGGRKRRSRVSVLRERDVERCLWDHGYEGVYRDAAGIRKQGTRAAPEQVIHKAIRNRSKPYLAITAAEACAKRGPEGIPPMIRRALEVAVTSARRAVEED